MSVASRVLRGAAVGGVVAGLAWLAMSQQQREAWSEGIRGALGQQQPSRGKRSEASSETKPQRAVQEPRDEDEEDALDAKFERAQKFAASGAMGKTENSVKLELYALFKQATAGNCTTEKPSMMEFVASSKWAAWKKLGDMPQSAAKQHYIEKVTEQVADWDKISEAELALRSLDAKKDSDQEGSGGLTPSVSLPSAIEDKPITEQTPVEQLFTLASAGETHALLDLIKERSVDINATRGADNETLLHMACDRNFPDMVKALLDKGADIEATDIDGLTPLAYALMNGHEVLCLSLKENGANIDAKDNDGVSILTLGTASLRSKLKPK